MPASRNLHVWNRFVRVVEEQDVDYVENLAAISNKTNGTSACSVFNDDCDEELAIVLAVPVLQETTISSFC